MPLANSPIFDDSPGDSVDSSQPSPQKPPQPKRGQILSPIRLVILILALVVLLLGIIEFILPVYGAVQGTVRDLDGQPLQVDVSIAGITAATQTDASGRFVLAHIPTGHQTLIVRYAGDDYVFQIDIPNEDGLNIGQIQIATGFETGSLPGRQYSLLIGGKYGAV